MRYGECSGHHRCFYPEAEREKMRPLKSNVSAVIKLRKVSKYGKIGIGKKVLLTVLFVDEIVSSNQDETVGIKTFDESIEFFNGHFPKFKIVTGTTLVESMAQCGGAGVRFRKTKIKKAPRKK